MVEKGEDSGKNPAEGISEIRLFQKYLGMCQVEDRMIKIRLNNQIAWCTLSDLWRDLHASPKPFAL
jgi:hypothetical protein